MKYQLLLPAALLLAGLASCSSENSSGEVTLTYADGLPHPDTLFVEHSLIKEIINAKAPEDIHTQYDTILWADNAFRIPVEKAGAASYSFRISDLPTTESFFTLYTEPGEKMEIKIKSLSPMTFSATGSELMEGIALLTDSIAPVTQEYVTIMANEDEANVDKIRDVASKFVDVNVAFIRNNPKSKAAPYALMQVFGDDSFTQLFEGLTPEARKSLLFPFVELQYNQLKGAEGMQQEAPTLISKGAEAPSFTLPDPEGKQVSLEDFRGKWVILDFWGSWCGWCVRGFPALKEAYAKYHPDGLEIIGIDCSDTDEEWRDALKKYELPWVQVFNGEDRSLLQAYGISSFPTKLIIDPEGKVANVTVGEDPTFFTALSNLLGK